MFDRTVAFVVERAGDEITGITGTEGSGLLGQGTHSPGTFVAMLIALALVAYFIGNISPSTMLARAQGLDIKQAGSGNAGTTNALRLMGKKAAIITLVVDIIKGIVAVAIGWLCFGFLGAMICTVAVVIGHIWPLIYKFKGGKGIATSFGALLMLDPLTALIELAVVAVGTLISKRMSVGSMIGLALLPFVALIRIPEFSWISVVMVVIMLLKHRQNFIRLIHGEEPKLGFLDKDKKAEKAKEAEEDKQD